VDAGLAERLSWQSRRVELPAGRYETLLPPTAVSDMLTYMYWSAGARDAGEGRTVFSRPGAEPGEPRTRVGERLSTVPLDLYSDPSYPGLECAPFVVAHASGRDSSVFDNGMPSPRATWLSAGVLSALHGSRYSAGLAGLPATPGVDNLILSAPGASASLESMIASTKRGLLLTCLWYIRLVDPQTLLLTGLTRDGVYLIEEGEVVGAVNNFRYNESPVGMLSRVLEVGATEKTLPREWGDYFNRAAMPALREVRSRLARGAGAPGHPGPPADVRGHQVPAAPVPDHDGHQGDLLRHRDRAVRRAPALAGAGARDRRDLHPVYRGGVRQRRTRAG
jgi:predicted Zn-dependent protease